MNKDACTLQLQKYIAQLTYYILKNEHGKAFFIKLDSLFKTKTGDAFITGVFDCPHLVSSLLAINIQNGDIMDNIIVIIKRYCSNIRNNLTLLDFFAKTFEKFAIQKNNILTETKGKIIVTHYINQFDNCIRHRNSISKSCPAPLENLSWHAPSPPPCDPKPIYEQGKMCVKDYGLFYEANPNVTPYNIDDCADIGSGELIEPYIPYEKTYIEEKYRLAWLEEVRKAKEKDVEMGLRDPQPGNIPNAEKIKIKTLDTGVNMFYLQDKPMDTIDIFAAGISGHTAEIGLLFNLFLESNPIEEGIMQKYVSVLCLTWMIDYLHHSLREILLGSCVYFRPSKIEDFTMNTQKGVKTVSVTKMINNINILYTPKADLDKIRQEIPYFLLFDNSNPLREGLSLNKIKAFLGQTIDELFTKDDGARIDIRRETDIIYNQSRDHMEDMVNYLLSDGIEAPSPMVSLKLNTIQKKLDNFKAYVTTTTDKNPIKNSLDKYIVFPNDATCNAAFKKTFGPYLDLVGSENVNIMQ